MILDDFQEIVSGEAGMNIQHALKAVVVEHKDDLDLNQWLRGMGEHVLVYLQKQKLALHKIVQVSFFLFGLWHST